jgi:ergothioneine biosynthesis protein EgtB
MTNSLFEPLSAEDMVVQAVEETSPTKWHLAHTTWFFETFILEAFEPGFRPFNPDFRVLFNSYYQTLGKLHPRPQRGMLTRPGLGEVLAYRDTIDERVVALLASASEESLGQLMPLVVLGLQHEQQHQELLLMDVKRLLHMNPTRPPYKEGAEWGDGAPTGEAQWLDIEGGMVEIGHGDPSAFAFDNELGRHRRLIEPFQIRSRPVTNGEFARFIEDGGYTRPEFWLDEGWAAICAEGWEKPIYWEREEDGAWLEYTLAGLRPINPDAPVVHISFFEADAFARWSGARLPTEAEWEASASTGWRDSVREGHFLEEGAFHPHPLSGRGFAGSVWEWTRSAHEPYPGYTIPEGPVGEYNGKFMCGSFVLRGGLQRARSHLGSSVARPDSHAARKGLPLARAGVRIAQTFDRHWPPALAPARSQND